MLSVANGYLLVLSQANSGNRPRLLRMPPWNPASDPVQYPQFCSAGWTSDNLPILR